MPGVNEVASLRRATVYAAASLMRGETHHDWILEDTGERFLRLKEAKVTTPRPFEEVPR